MFKKYNRDKKLLFIEEQFLYILKDISVNKSDEKMRRIARKFDLCKLSSIEAKEENKKYIYKLQFLKRDYFDRENKVFIFDEEEANLFYQNLIEVFEKYESTFFSNLDDDEDEEEEEEDDEENDENVDESIKKIDLGAKNRINFNDQDNDLISSSRKKII